MSANPPFGYIPYWSLRTRTLIPAATDANGFALWQEDGSMVPFADYYCSFERTREVLERLDAHLGDDTVIARVEMLYDAAQRRGVLLYDARGNLVLHVLIARLGYPGSARGATDLILRHLGVPRRMFLAMNSKVWGRPYALVLSRQLRVNIENADIAWCDGRVLPDWKWRDVGLQDYCATYRAA